MPLFHFNVRHQGETVFDEQGQELAHVAEAYDAAICDIRGMICEEFAATGTWDLGGSIEVVSDGRSFEVPFAEAFEGPARH
jgi:hypothetical protein